jgi:hypothetical protein
MRISVFIFEFVWNTKKIEMKNENKYLVNHNNNTRVDNTK